MAKSEDPEKETLLSLKFKFDSISVLILEVIMEHIPRRSEARIEFWF